MASGRIHAVTTVALSLGFAPIVLSAVKGTPELLILIPGIMLGILITPDLDIDHRIVSHRYMRNMFGRVVGMYWYYLWHSYSICFKHRSALSHLPIISTLIRLTFLAFPPIIVLFRNQQTGTVKLIPYLLLSTVMVIPIWGLIYLVLVILQANILVLLFLVLGLALADLLHFIIDLL
jgi:uncharacterized metal-binding protein